MDEYTANPDDVRSKYAAGVDAEEAERRRRAFDRMVRQIQDEAYEDGQADADFFGRDGH